MINHAHKWHNCYNSQQWHVPSTNEKLVSALLFDQVKVSKPASKSETLQSRLQQPSTYCMFAKYSNVDDIRNLRLVWNLLEPVIIYRVF